MAHALINGLVDDQLSTEDDPLIAPLMREQLEAMMGGRRDGGVSSPERALMRALMQDAVLCLLGAAAPANERPRLIAQARAWVRSRSRAWIFSFECVCEALGIDPEYGREQLLAMGAKAASSETTAGAGKGSLRGMRGLRHGGQRPRKAIHFLDDAPKRVRAAG